MQPTQHDNSPAKTGGQPRLAGLLAEFASAEALVAAARRTRDAGYRRWDCYSPFPVHGIDRAMGTRRTILPWLVFGAGCTGAGLALLMQWWMNAVDYPIIISGKPLFSVPASIPIFFELTVLFSALTAFFGTFALNRLPQFYHYAFSAANFRRVTTDGFFLAVDVADPMFDIRQTAALLDDIGAQAVETCYEPTTGRKLPAFFAPLTFVLALAALVPVLLVAKARAMRSTEQPRLHIIQDMDFQEKYKPQATSPLFADGRAERLPVAGTIARGDLEADEHLWQGKQNGQWATTFPPSLPVTAERMHRGQQMFGVYCSACHGLLGLGDGTVSQRAFRREEPKWVRPSSLQDEAIRKQPVGQLFDSISHGIRQMPAYEHQISVQDRWNILLYLRALQHSQNGTRDDVLPGERDKIR